MEPIPSRRNRRAMIKFHGGFKRFNPRKAARKPAINLDKTEADEAIEAERIQAMEDQIVGKIEATNKVETDGPDGPEATT